jgi:ATP-dependent protease ClpP protease subunit|tara:strand:- start:88 stop:753 length:666 start_codon:yes stop_codon:yes gene_type:complete
MKKHSEDLDFNGYISSTREMFLLPLESEDSEIITKTATHFLKNLRLLEAESKNPIVLHSFSLGGDWYDGMVIYDAIKYSACKFVIISYGIAASMASLIPQAVFPQGKRITMPNCDWMIHEGYTATQGTYRQVLSGAQWDTILRSRTYQMYTEPCMQTGEFFKDKKQSQVKSYIKRKLESKEDWWMSSEDSIKYGFCDHIVGEKGMETVDKIVKNVSRILQL